jgi:hypothetical protein
LHQALRLGGGVIGRKKVAARQRVRFGPKTAERYARFLDVSSGELLFGMAVKPGPAIIACTPPSAIGVP